VKEKDIQEYRIDPGNSDEGRDQPKPPLLTLAFNAARLASRIATICFRMRARQLLWQQEAVYALQQGKRSSFANHPLHKATACREATADKCGGAGASSVAPNAR